MKILDCTLRDGGYYTNWDFDESLVKNYILALNSLPVDYVEIGYRSNEMPGYLGEFFYCPIHRLEMIKGIARKKIAIMINEKDCETSFVSRQLKPCKGLISLVRLAVDPNNFERSLCLAEEIKKIGFEVCLNVMYMTKWSEKSEFLSHLSKMKDFVDYFYMVDSYGGAYPKTIERVARLIKERTTVTLGFHGHNNLEQALVNTLAAFENGVDIVDATIMGMGRGAGNLKTELLLTVLNSTNDLEIDFNALSGLMELFAPLQQKYNWGPCLPYMVSGANSLPQKDVMEWVGKRYFSLNSIIRALTNKAKGLKDNIHLPAFKADQNASAVLIVGGGLSVKSHESGIKELLHKRHDIAVIHASSKNSLCFSNISNCQIHCLAGNEGYRLEANLANLDLAGRIAVLPPYPRTMGTYIPSGFGNNAFQLTDILFVDKFKESITSVVMQTALELGAQEFYFVGYDGYSGTMNDTELGLFNENQYLFSKLAEKGVAFCSLTPTLYGNLPAGSVYGLLCKE